MYTYNSSKGSYKRNWVKTGLGSWLISLGLLGIIVGLAYLLSSGSLSTIYPVGSEISYNNFQVEVFQVNYSSGRTDKDLLFCNYGVVEVEVAVRLKDAGFFKSSENVIADQFKLYNAKTDRLHIQPTTDNGRQPAFKGGNLQVGETQRGWLTFCPFEAPQNLQLRFLPQHPGKGVTPLKIDLQPAVKSA